MNDFQGRLYELGEEFNTLISYLEKNHDSLVEIKEIKTNIIRIEAQISQTIEQYKVAIRKDDKIATSKREEFLSRQIQQIGVDPANLSARRLAAINFAYSSFSQRREQTQKESRERLLGEDSQLEVMKISELKQKSASNMASEVTSRLEKTKASLKEQIAASAQSLEIFKDSTALLDDVDDATSQIESVQSRTKRALRRLKLAQNWDLYLLKGSIYFFVFCCVITIIHGFKNSLITKILGKLIKLFFFAFRNLISQEAGEANAALPIDN